MRLIIAAPLAIAVDEPGVRQVRAEDETGCFGIRPGHADFLTALEASVVSWRDERDRLHHAAVRGGVLSVSGGDMVRVATPEAVVGTDLAQLETEVLRRFRRQAEAERSAGGEALRLNVAAVRTIVRLLRPGLHGAGPGGPDAVDFSP